MAATKTPEAIGVHRADRSCTAAPPMRGESARPPGWPREHGPAGVRVCRRSHELNSGVTEVPADGPRRGPHRGRCRPSLRRGRRRSHRRGSRTAPGSDRCTTRRLCTDAGRSRPSYPDLLHAPGTLDRSERTSGPRSRLNVDVAPRKSRRRVAGARRPRSGRRRSRGVAAEKDAPCALSVVDDERIPNQQTHRVCPPASTATSSAQPPQKRGASRSLLKASRPSSSSA